MGTRQGGWVVTTLVMGLAGGLDAAQMPEPLASAVMLLGWSGADLPQIEIVEGRPAAGTATAEAWVRFDTGGQAIPVIYVRSDTEVYRDALGKDYQALVRLAGILAHERWHLRHGLDEAGAYTAQLSAMEYLHANAARLAEVRRAWRHVSGQKPADAAGPAHPTPQPRPIEAALNLLSWRAAETPTIVVVAERPPTLNKLSEGWVAPNSDGTARPTIYIAGWSELYRDALAKPYVLHNIIRLAGVLAHEQVHIRNGPDEELAYAEQLITLERLHAAPLEITNVRRALESVRRQNRARP